MLKIIKVNESEVACEHAVKVNDKTHQTHVHLTIKVGDGKDAVELTHVMTVGAEDQPLPANYGATCLQHDLDVFRDRHAALAESKLRAKKLARELK